MVTFMDKKAENAIRAKFREEVFARDGSMCVVPGCKRHAADAHHIIERALWKDPSELGGYMKDNGASLCELHHMDAEQGFLSPTALRRYIRLANLFTILPKGFDPNKDYDKWGRELELPARWSIKYPHTSYLTISPGFDPEDVREGKTVTAGAFIAMPTVITTKMDGSNIFFDHEKVAARNGYDATHRSFDMAKALHAEIKDNIPDDIQVFCEWLYAKHSIHYNGDNALEGFCQVFSVYDRTYHEFLPWDSVKKCANLLSLPTVPVMSEGMRFVGQNDFNATMFKFGKIAISNGHEGIVVRNAHSFHFSTFWKNVGKFVRPNHVSTSKHWMQEKITRNEVK